MADRYWVGGTADWDGTAGTKWATTSGGAGGAAVPTTSDEVFFDANSGAGTTTVTTTASCNSLNFTGYVGTLNGGGQIISVNDGSVTFVAGMTYTSPATISWNPNANVNLTTGGKTMGAISWSGGASSVHLDIQDALTSSGGITFSGTSCELDTNNFAIQCTDMTIGASCVLNAGSSTITITGTAGFSASSSSTVNAATSTINLTNSGVVTFAGGGKTYNNVTFSGSGTITGANTFATFTGPSSGGGKTLTFPASTTNTATTWANLSGASAASQLTIISSTPATQATLSDSAGTITSQFSAIRDIAVIGGATWNANTCSNNGNNSGWIWDTYTNPANAYGDDSSYATATATSGIISIRLSKDSSSTYTSTLTKTATADEEYLTYGAGTTELWGTTWTGASFSNTNFRLKIGCGTATAETIYKTFDFDNANMPSSATVTGVEVVVRAKWESGTSTTSINHIKVRVYYGNSLGAIGVGSLAYATNGRKAAETAGNGKGVLVFYDSQSKWIACDSGSEVAA